MKKTTHGGPIRTGGLSAENVKPGQGSHGSHVRIGGLTVKRKPTRSGNGRFQKH